MAKFSSSNQPAKRGRPKGQTNKLTHDFRVQGYRLLNNLMKRALDGDDEAAKMVLPFMPKPKTYTDKETIDGEYLQARVKEINEFEERLEKLEQQANE